MVNTIPQGLEAPHYPGYTKLRLGVPKGVFGVFGYKGNLRTDCGGSHREGGWGTCEDLPVAVAVLLSTGNVDCQDLLHTYVHTYARTYTRTYVHTSVQCVVYVYSCTYILTYVCTF